MERLWIGILLLMVSIFILGLVAWVKQIEVNMPVKLNYNNNIIDVKGGLK